MRIVSWNVNGLRACAKRGFLDFLESSNADVVALQEVRAFPEQLPPNVLAPPNWHVCFAPAKRPGYSGVAIYSKTNPSRVETSLVKTALMTKEDLSLRTMAGWLWFVSTFPKAVARIVIILACHIKWIFIRLCSIVLRCCVSGVLCMWWVITTLRTKK